MSKGYITHYNKELHYGFIESPDLGIEEIYFYKKSRVKSYKNLIQGDFVEFEIVESEMYSSKWEANAISFIHNRSKENLKIDFEKQNVLFGFVKKVSDVFYVKDSSTYIFIKLLISPFEKGFLRSYDDLLNKGINYKIVEFTDTYKMKAIKTDCQYVEEYYTLLNKTPIVGIVEEKCKGGYLIQVFDKYEGFLPASLLQKNQRQVGIGEKIDLVCIKINENSGNVVFDLLENFEDEMSDEKSSTTFVNSLQIGDKVLGKVKLTKSYGVFFKIDCIEALLHINRIIEVFDLKIKEGDRSGNQIILEQHFPIESEWNLEIESIDGNRISLSLA